MADIIIVARYPTIRAGLRSVIDLASDIATVADTDAPEQLPELIEESSPDLLLIDLVDDPQESFEAVRRFANDGLLPPVVLLFGSATDALDGLDIPNASLLLRDASPDEIHTAIRSLATGLVALDPRILAEISQQLEWQNPAPVTEPAVSLTPRELQVLHGIARGLPNKTIASDLGISEHTVKFHVGSIFQKLGVASRSEAVAVAARQGLFVV